MNWLLHVEVIKDLKTPVLETPERAIEPSQLVTTGIGSDLKQAAIDAVRAMIELITAKTKCSPEDAYILCSLAGDLKISELVNLDSFVVSFYLARMFDL